MECFRLPNSAGCSLYRANLDAMLTVLNHGFGMSYVFTDEWTPGGIWGPCDPDNSLYLTFASEILAVLHDHGVAHVLNSGITLGIDADGTNTMSRANFLYLCSQVDGLTLSIRAIATSSHLQPP